ncbi:MAG: hypothetical protein WCF12_07625 [Propionicimonas sp.]
MLNLARLIAALFAVLVTISLSEFPAFADWGDVGVEGQGSGAFTGSASNGDQTPVRPGTKRPSKTPTTSAAERDAAACRARFAGTSRISECFGFFQPVGPSLTRADAASIARTLVVRLQLPDPTPQFGPDPAANEWDMAAVGYPLWLWTNGPRTVTSTTSASGMTFTLRARYRSTTFSLGDGHSVSCTSTTPYSASTRPGTPSPTCGYRYAKPSGTNRGYTVTATTHWTVSWRVAGFSGSLPGTHTASRQLRVGELQAIVVR